MEIRTRNDLIKWLEDNATCPAIKRALIYGSNENLGGFGKIIGNAPGWIVKVTGKKQEWIVGIFPNTNLLLIKSDITYSCYILNKVPWRCWEGDKSKNSLYQGDYPERYKELRNGETG